MNLMERRIKILEEVLNREVDKQYELEVGIEIKELMLIENPQYEQAPKLEQIITQEKFMLENQKQAINIIDRKLSDLKMEYKASQPNGTLKA